MEPQCKLRSSVLQTQNAHAPHISRARRRVAMVASAAPRGQEETVEGRTLAHSGNSPRAERNRWKARAERISEPGTLDQPTSTRAEKQMSTGRRFVGSELVVTPRRQC
ncbi:hypothetical protein NDU88_004684 [Pleurodeles waltl]|uniref:Uncharacterized protein n=1 Tax=Pleurodeles waltl TaxID=8319 RepID=A0AAV7WYZ6_PLEWA|nr:hypothetical protein NDU88_004684 [Pleurodeles waltl]